MADNVTADAGSGGATFRTDDDGTAHWPYTKIAFGADDTQTIVGSISSNPLPVALSATDNAVLDAIAASLAGTLTVGAHAVTNAGTFAVQSTLQAGTAEIGKLAAGTASIGDIGTVTAVTGITNPITANPASGTIDTVSTVTNLSQLGGAAVPMTTTQADALANTLDSLNVTGFNYVFNGTTWDRVREGAVAGSLLVDGTGSTFPVSGTITAVTDITNTVTVDGTGTFAVQVDGAALTSLQLIDDAVHAEAAALSKGLLIALDDGTDAQFAQANASGHLKVDIATDTVGIGGGTQYTEDAAAAANPVGNAMMVVREDARAGSLTTTDGDNVALRGNNRGELYTLDTDAVALLTTIDADTGNIAAGYAAEGSALGSGVLLQGDDGTDRTNVLVDTDGHLQVDILTGGGSNASVFVDDAAFTLTSSSLTVAGGIRDDTLSSLAAIEGDAIPLRVNSTGALHVTGAGGGTQYNIDDAGGATDTGTLALAIRDDSLTTLTPVDGDYVGLRVNSTGALHVTGGGGGTEYTEDVASANPIVGTATLMERDDALTTVTPIEGDWIGLRGTAEGALWVQDFNSDASLALLTTVDADTSTIAGDTTSIDGKITACDTGAVVLSSGTVTTVSTVTTCNLAAETTKVIGTVNIAAAQTVTVTATALDTRALTNADVVTAELSATDNAVLDQIVTNTTGLAGTVSGTELQVDVVAALPAGTNAIGKLAANSGVVIGDVNIPSVATGGATPGKRISLASTNATSVKASAGNIYSLQVFNTNAAARYLKLYNKASAPTVGTDTPVQVYTIPGNTAGAGLVVPIPVCGIAFSTGIAFAMTTGAADSDTAAVAANEIVLSYSYK